MNDSGWQQDLGEKYVAGDLPISETALYTAGRRAYIEARDPSREDVAVTRSICEQLDAVRSLSADEPVVVVEVSGGVVTGTRTRGLRKGAALMRDVTVLEIDYDNLEDGDRLAKEQLEREVQGLFFEA